MPPRLHYGTFDYSAACGVSAAHQSIDHPAADYAKAVMQVAAAGTGVRLSDGSTNVLPVGPTAQVHSAWRLHYGLVRRSLARAYYQGWDMHPGHLPTRYAAVYAFYREGLDTAAARLAAYAAKAGGDVMDEPATARALSGYLLRGLDCGAADPAEVSDRTGLSRAELDALRRALSCRAAQVGLPGSVQGPGGNSPEPRAISRTGSSILLGSAGATPSSRRKSSWAALRPSRRSVLGDHGDRRIEQVGELEVVEADQRDPVRAARQHPHRGDGHPVVAGEQGGDRLGSRQHRVQRGPHPVRGRGAHRAPVGVDRQARGRHRLAVAAQPLGRGVDARLVADEADPAVAVRDEVGDAVAGPARVVGEHHVRVEPAGRPVHEHGGDAGVDLRAPDSGGRHPRAPPPGRPPGGRRRRAPVPARGAGPRRSTR